MQKVLKDKNIFDSYEDFLPLIFQKRQEGLTFVFVRGIFDLLHPGHLVYLKRAKKEGDLLVVGLTSDLDTAKFKGKGRPIIKAQGRAAIVGNLKCVDYVILLPDQSLVGNPNAFAPEQALKPEVFCLPETSPIKKEVADFVASYGGRIKILPYSGITSTTEIIQKLKKN